MTSAVKATSTPVPSRSVGLLKGSVIKSVGSRSKLAHSDIQFSAVDVQLSSLARAAEEWEWIKTNQEILSGSASVCINPSGFLLERICAGLEPRITATERLELSESIKLERGIDPHLTLRDWIGAGVLEKHPGNRNVRAGLNMGVHDPRFEGEHGVCPYNNRVS
jgi:hypothetical protein